MADQETKKTNQEPNPKTEPKSTASVAPVNAALPPEAYMTEQEKAGAQAPVADAEAHTTKKETE